MSIVIRKCARCGHEWPQRGQLKPKQCPNCRSPYWYVPRMKAQYDRNDGLWYIAEYDNVIGWFVASAGRYPDKKLAENAIIEIRSEAAAQV